MFGLRKGAEGHFEIEPEQGFGAPNPENVHILYKEQFSKDLDLEVGLVVSFSNPDDQTLPGVITKTYEDTVEIDFNHPLAGRRLLFDVSILDVAQVSDEILRM